MTSMKTATTIQSSASSAWNKATASRLNVAAATAASVLFLRRRCETQSANPGSLPSAGPYATSVRPLSALRPVFRPPGATFSKRRLQRLVYPGNLALSFSRSTAVGIAVQNASTAPARCVGHVDMWHAKSSIGVLSSRLEILQLAVNTRFSKSPHGVLSSIVCSSD
jgi:hypothetical protein